MITYPFYKFKPMSYSLATVPSDMTISFYKVIMFDYSCFLTSDYMYWYIITFSWVT